MLKGLVFIISIGLAQGAEAANVMVAVASNFTRPMQAIMQDLGEQKPDVVYGSTGKLYAQISNGAPFDLFLAADLKRPERLFAAGLASKTVTYAVGRVVLWSRVHEICAAPDWQAALLDPRLTRVAIANPETAPYGTTAYRAIMALSGAESIKGRMVFGQNVAQAFQFATMVTGAGFVAQSLVMGKEGQKGCFWPIPEAAPVAQGACVMTKSRHQKEAASFLEFLRGDVGRAILRRFGYGV